VAADVYFIIHLVYLFMKMHLLALLQDVLTSFIVLSCTSCLDV